MRRLRRVVSLSALLLVAPLVLAGPASAATTDPVAAATGWLSTQFADESHLPAPDGDHFDSKFGSAYYPLYGANADVLFALAGAKAGGDKAKVALDYLDAHLDDYADISGAFGGPYDGSVAKVALAHLVAGTDADGLLTTLQDDECPAASTTCTPGAPANIFSSVSASFVILAEARAGGTFAPSPAAVDYFLTLQCDSGGFTTKTAACGSGDADIDATSYAIMTLQALGGHAGEIADAADWLSAQRAAGGYWVSQGIPNTNSTGLATAALAGVGRDVASSRAWLLDQKIGAGQPGAGALKYDAKFTASTTSATSPSVLATAQGILGLVDNGSLATVTAGGSSDGVDFLPPALASSTPSLAAGGTVTLNAAGFAAGQLPTVSLCRASGSCVYLLPRIMRVAPDGTVSISVLVPDPIPPGEYTIVVATTPDLSASVPLTVTGSAASTPPATTSSGTRTATASPIPGSGASTSPPLANTGADTTSQLPLGIAAVVAGLVLLVVARERRRRGRHAA